MGYPSMALCVFWRALVTQLPLQVSPLPIPMAGTVSTRQAWYVSEEDEDEGDEMLIFLSCAFFLMCVLQ
jgi:hypothetical protein